MSLFDGLHFYEIVLLMMGALLFFVLLFVFVYYVITKQPLTKLGLFFVFPIIMVGFSGIQKIEYENGKVTIEKRTEQVAQNPSDTTARRALEESLLEVEARPNRTPGTLVTLGKAHEALGDSIKALAFADSALQLKPDFREAALLKEQINTPRVREGAAVYKGVLKLKENPDDTLAKKRLVESLPLVEKSFKSNPSVFLTLAEANAAIGDTAKALQFADSAQKYMVSSKQAIQLKETILAKQRRER